jgi:hypothetical protein
MSQWDCLARQSAGQFVCGIERCQLESIDRNALKPAAMTIATIDNFYCAAATG